MKNLRKQSGASMVEALLALPVILVFAVLLFDGFFLLSAMLRITNTTSQVSREISTSLAEELLSGAIPEDNCDLIRQFACEILTTRAEGTTGLASVTYTVSVSENPYGGLPVTVVRVANPVTCIFCRFQNLQEVSFTEVLSLEVPFNLNCPDPVCD